MSVSSLKIAYLFLLFTIHSIKFIGCGQRFQLRFRFFSLLTYMQPERPDEMERVEAAGGKIINCDGYRVLGVLATSRSIGTLAFDYGWILAAILPSLTINFAGDGYLKPYVISVPEVTVTNRTAKDEFLVLASDGLWDVMSNELVCRVARRCLSGAAKKRLPTAEPLAGRTRSALAAATLAELALNRGSYDNISVVVVDLKLRTKRSRA
uniref:PPM-type phosphatase domain-containing protein n=1 Tax=Nymphaea colorata TaxID=210225 RepID=A0A5K0WAP3_9MAGN